MNRNDTRPFEDQRFGVPGVGTESEADQHLKGMVKNQLNTDVTLQRYNMLVYKFCLYLKTVHQWFSDCME